MPDPDEADFIYDADAATFEARVVEASKERPVVVDFWAPWCAPCRALTPVLEKVVRSYGGRAALARVNVDENQALAAGCGVRGIPAVKVFRDGRVAAEFVGALPEAEVARVLSAVVPSAADETAAEGRQLLREGKQAEAERRFREVLAAEERHPTAAAGLALVMLQRGDLAEARRLAGLVEPGTPDYEEAQAVTAQLDFVEQCRKAGGRKAVAARVKADETDLDARYDLAACLAAAGDYRAALDEFLAILAADKAFRDGAAKAAMVRIFGIVGQRSALADDYRARLARLLY